MHTVYEKEAIGPMNIIRSKTYGSFYGICSCFSIEFYYLQNCCSVFLKLENTPEKAIGRNSVSGCLIDNLLKISERKDGTKRTVEQKIDIEDLCVQICRFQDFSVFVANEADIESLINNIKEEIEHVLRFMVYSIYSSVSKDFRERAIDVLSSGYYANETEKTLENLTKLNWPFLFSLSNINNDLKEFLVNRLDNLEIDYPSLDNITEEVIDNKAKLAAFQEVREHKRIIAEEKRKAVVNLARDKALQLLKLVCRKEEFELFEREKHLIVENQGWSFNISEGHSVKVKSPSGGSGSLCVFLSKGCHPIDSICIKYLYAKNKIRELFKSANAFGCEIFQKDKNAMMKEKP